MLTIKDATARGWTFAALARALQVDPATIYRWRKHTEPKLVRLALAQLIATETPEAHSETGPLVTYFIRCADTVKIGCARNVQARLAQLQISNANQLVLLGTTLEPEASVHARFATHRLRGEWFKLVPEIEAYALLSK